MKKILFVDDHAVMIRLGSIILPKLGYEFVAKENGQEAWDYLTGPEGNLIDLLFTDHQMPIMDGLELTRRIGGSDNFHSLPIVMASGGTTDRKEALTAGVNEFIEKPYTIPSLRETLSKYLN